MPSSSVSPSLSPSASKSPSASVSPSSPILDSDSIVTLSEMRTFLNIPSSQTGKDSLLIELINSYKDEIEQYLGVGIINTTYTEYYDGNGTDCLFLKHYPIVSVTTLTIDDTAQTENTDFYIYGDEGYLKLEDDVFEADLHNVYIIYTAGWGANRDAVPNPIKTALKQWVMRVFKAEVIDFSQRFDESSLANIKSQMMPWDIKQKLDYYRCRKWGRAG
jgi:hypothetical protein